MCYLFKHHILHIAALLDTELVSLRFLERYPPRKMKLSVSAVELSLGLCLLISGATANNPGCNADKYVLTAMYLLRA
jgi:hypothetical protein